MDSSLSSTPHPTSHKEANPVMSAQSTVTAISADYKNIPKLRMLIQFLL